MKPAPQPQPIQASNRPRLGLGIDAGGTQTRWALATASGQIAASGTAAGLSALQTCSDAGRDFLQQIFAGLANTALPHGQVERIHAGITGYAEQSRTLPHMLAAAFELAPEQVRVCNDIEISYLDIFQPGAGYLIYAGTGSIGAYIDEHGQFHRAGGHGYLIDDAGGGFWIAREALRQIWRNEDEQPGIWRSSPLAKALFEQIGGSGWNDSRQFIYHKSRGEIGKLALAVGACADQDDTAMAILRQAGCELARLGHVLSKRFGAKPMALAGRVQELHPVIEQTVRAHLPPNTCIRQSTSQAHFAAARLAAKKLT